MAAAYKPGVGELLGKRNETQIMKPLPSDFLSLNIQNTEH